MQDVADATASSLHPFVVVRQQTAAPQLVTGPATDIATFRFDAVAGAVVITWINVTLQGTYGPSTFSSFALVDSLGNSLARASVVGSRVYFGPLSFAVPDGGSLSGRLRPAVNNYDGTTVGAFLRSPTDIVAQNGGVSLVRPLTGADSLAYIGTVPSTARIDGGFAEWTNTTLDALGDVSPPGRQDLDISRYAFAPSGGNVTFMVQTAGTVLNGTLVPSANRVFSGNVSAPADSDRDGVPDSVDPLPNDFNNDGIPDAATNGDYDGDGITDYGFPGGTDVWLNTTIPATFPAPYAGRTVSVYIGPVQRPIALGLDTARFYLDQDGSAASGYSIGGIGADYLMDVEGKQGAILAVGASRFNGTNPGQWSWGPIGPATAAKDRSRIEAEVSSVAITNASRAYISMSGWPGASDNTAPVLPSPSPAQFVTLRAAEFWADRGSAPSGTGGVHTLDISGNQQWFFTSGSTTATGCTTNLAASTTAGASATSTTLSGTQSICWFTPLDVPDSISGVWEAILDTTQVSTGTTVLGPTANGDVTGWTINGQGSCNQEGNEWRCVDDAPNDGDNTYVSSTSSSALESIYNLADWSGAPSPLTITNVNVEASCRRTTSSAVSVKILVKSGGTTTAGATSQNCANSATYTVWSEDWATNPTTSSAWTLSDINALQAGVRDADASTLEVRVSHVRVTVTFVPVYSVEIDRCTNSACSTLNVLYGPTNGNTFGNDVTFTTGTIAAQTLGATERIRFKVTMVAGGSISVRYNGAYPGTDDSRATVPIPEFGDIAPPVVATLMVILVVRRQRTKRSRRESPSS